MILTLSIITIKEIKYIGVLSGNKCFKEFIILFLKLIIINLNHKGNPKDKEKIRWDVVGKI